MIYFSNTKGYSHWNDCTFLHCQFPKVSIFDTLIMNAATLRAVIPVDMANSGYGCNNSKGRPGLPHMNIVFHTKNYLHRKLDVKEACPSQPVYGPWAGRGVGGWELFVSVIVHSHKHYPAAATELSYNLCFVHLSLFFRAEHKKLNLRMHYANLYIYPHEHLKFGDHNSKFTAWTYVLTYAPSTYLLSKQLLG